MIYCFQTFSKPIKTKEALPIYGPVKVWEKLEIAAIQEFAELKELIDL